MTEFKNKWVLITGASSGIGKAFAEKLAREGSNLILVARSEDVLQELATELKKKNNIEVIVIPKDLSLLNSARELFDEVQRRGISVDVLVNNAGFGVGGKLHETKLERNQEMLMLNVVAVSSLTQLFLAPMLAKKSGIIINISSIAAFLPLPYMANYGASKAFVRYFTEAIWAEYLRDGIQVLSVCPGPTATNFGRVMGREAYLTGSVNAESVVEQSLKALEKKKIYVICGPIKNYLLGQLERFVSHKFIARMIEIIMRRRASQG